MNKNTSFKKSSSTSNSSLGIQHKVDIKVDEKKE